MIRRPPRSTRTDTLFPYTTLFRSIEGRLAGQGSTAYRPSLSADGRQFPAHPGLPARWDGAAEYLALFPNVLFGVDSDHFYSVMMEPLGVDRTREHLAIYYLDEEVLTAGSTRKTVGAGKSVSERGAWGGGGVIITT